MRLKKCVFLCYTVFVLVSWCLYHHAEAMQSTDSSHLISMVREAVRQCSLVEDGSPEDYRKAASKTCSQVFTALQNDRRNICGGYSTKPKCRPQETGYQCTVKILYDGLAMKLFGSLARRFATIEDCMPELITAARTLLSATSTLPLPGVADSSSTSQRRDKGKAVLGFPAQRQSFGGGSGARGSSPFNPFRSGGYPQLPRTSSFDPFGFLSQRGTTAGPGGFSGRNPFQTGGHLQPSGSLRSMRPMRPPPPPLPGSPPRGPRPSVRVAPSVVVPPSFRGADPPQSRSTPPRWGDSLPGTPRLASDAPPPDLDPTFLVDPSYGVSDFINQSPGRASCFLKDISSRGTPQQAPPQDVDPDLDMDTQSGRNAHGDDDDDSDSGSDSEDEEENIPPPSEGSKTAGAASGSGRKRKRTDEILPCPVCSKTFTYLKSFEVHIKKKHAIIDPEGNCGCRKCGSSFGKEIGELVEHMQSKHNRGKRPAQVTSCPFCRRFFPSKDSLDTHIRAHADVDSEGNYGCKVCGLPVSKSAEELNQHMISEHNFGANVHVCPECKHPFNDQRMLKKHAKAHTNLREKIFKCQHCTRKPIFTRHQSYITHMEEFHNPGKHYNCDAPNCGAIFFSKRKLQEHKTKEHTDKTTCPACNTVLSSAWALKRHRIDAKH